MMQKSKTGVSTFHQCIVIHLMDTDSTIILLIIIMLHSTLAFKSFAIITLPWRSDIIFVYINIKIPRQSRGHIHSKINIINNINK